MRAASEIRRQENRHEDKMRRVNNADKDFRVGWGGGGGLIPLVNWDGEEVA